jgi:hypothetical protein
MSVTSDTEAIQRVIHLYGYIIDDKEWSRLGEIFAPNFSFTIAGTDIAHSGLDDVTQFMSSITHPLAHYSTNVVIDVEEGADVATARVKLFAPRADGTAAVATYNDKLVRTAEGWRFASRYVVTADLRWLSSQRSSS